MFILYFFGIHIFMILKLRSGEASAQVDCYKMLVSYTGTVTLEQ